MQGNAPDEEYLDPHGECVAVIDQLSTRNAELEKALRAILAEPHGCVFCDSGKLRNPVKHHAIGCGFWLASCALQQPLT